MNTDRFLNAYVELMTSTLHDALGKNIVFQAQAKIKNEDYEELNKEIEKLNAKLEEFENIEKSIEERENEINSKNAEIGKLRNDYEMWLQLFEQIKDNKELRADVFPFFTGLHRLHNSSLTKSKLKSAFYWWKYLCLSKHKLATRLFCYLCYFIFTIKLRFLNFDRSNESNRLKSLI